MESIRSKITLAYFVASTLLVLLLLIPLGIAIQGFFYEQLISRLETETAEIELVIQGSRTESWDRLSRTLGAIANSASMRITLIRVDGGVLYESSLPESLRVNMENHLQRPEIQEALRDGVGSNARHSMTLDIDMVYAARKVAPPTPSVDSRLEGLGFVRIGLSSNRVSEEVRRIWIIIVVGGFLAVTSIFFVSRAVAARITRPLSDIATIVKEIKAGDLTKQLPVRGNDEIGRLSELINEMTAKVREDIERLQRLEQFRSEFLGNVSHELRTPIFSLKGFLETLLEGAISDPSVNTKFVEKAYQHAGRLDALLMDLIEISRIESGEMRMSFRYFDVTPFLETVKDDFADEAEKKNQKLVVVSVSDETLVFGDKERLRQALGNILDNAVKYSSEGSSIIIRAILTDETVRISVEDRGPGIAPEHLARIFERFYRVDKNRSREVGGTGLGLAIAKHIVEAHQTKIHVQSEPGKGSVFYFDLKK